MQQYAPVLLNEINELKPNLLIPLGELSFNYLTTLRGIRKFRGSVMLAAGDIGLVKPYKVMPILGPYPFLYQDEKQKYINRIDFLKIPKYLNEAPPPDNLYNIWICRQASALRAFFERSYDKDGLLVFDIETYMGIPTCISLCFDGFESVCVPLLDWGIDLDNRVLMMGLVAKLLDSPIKKVNQNIKYDKKILERWGFRVRNIVGDTMLAASSLYCEFPKNLGFLTSIYTDLPYFKDEGRQFDPTRHKKEQFYLYNAKDSLATYQIYDKQRVEIGEQGVEYVYQNLIKLMPIYERMENRGILIDLDIREKLTIKYESLYETEVMKLKRLAGNYNLNPLSHVQINKLVFDALGFKKIRGVKGTDEDSLELLMALGSSNSEYGKAVLTSVIGCRKLHKVLEILYLPLYPDNRFRCEFNLAGTENARTSAGTTTDELLMLNKKGKLTAEQLGHSLQTIGKHGFMLDGITYGRDIRSMFIASPGYKFVEIDLAGAEARVDAVLAGITDLSYFDSPGIHKLTGSWCFDCSPAEINKVDIVQYGDAFINRYHVAKQVRHAAERNIQAAGLVTKLLWGLTVKQGEVLLSRVHGKQPEIRETFHAEVKDAVTRTRLLVAPNGRRRDFFDKLDNHTFNEAFSFLPQAIVSDQTKFGGILPTFNDMVDCYLLSEQHDGILSEVPNARVSCFVERYKKNVERVIDFKHCTLSRDVGLVIPSEASVGENWFELKELK